MISVKMNFDPRTLRLTVKAFPAMKQLQRRVQLSYMIRISLASVRTHHRISSDPIKPTTPKVKNAKAIPKAKKES